MTHFQWNYKGIYLFYAVKKSEEHVAILPKEKGRKIKMCRKLKGVKKKGELPWQIYQNILYTIQLKSYLPVNK